MRYENEKKILSSKLHIVEIDQCLLTGIGMYIFDIF